jgi:hypothetical protein
MALIDREKVGTQSSILAVAVLISQVSVDPSIVSRAGSHSLHGPGKAAPTACPSWVGLGPL